MWYSVVNVLNPFNPEFDFPNEKYLFKVNNRNTRTTTMKFFAVSLLLTWESYFPIGPVDKSICKGNNQNTIVDIICPKVSIKTREKKLKHVCCLNCSL